VKRLTRILAVAALVIAAVFAAGVSLPREHTAAVRVRLDAPPESVYAAIADVARSAEWREDVTSVEVLDADPLRWRETGEWGTLTFVRVQADTHRRLVHRIEDTGEPFGGTWTYALVSTDGGTALTITEDGWVSNPVFRLMSRFVFGHHSTLEAYARDLGGRFGQSVELERVR
jgi:hypothetical protein